MRSSGILLPVFSLPSPYGIGTLGQAAYDFVDFLSAAGQRYWQVLPIGPTSYGDSPYQSFSTFAGNPYFIDLDFLKLKGLLTKEEIAAHTKDEPGAEIDYAFLFENRFTLLKMAYGRFHKPGDFEKFCEAQKSWLFDYALFMAIKAENGHISWQEWQKALKLREEKAIESAKKRLKNEIGFYVFLQYLFFTQWAALKKYAKKKGVKLIGDTPIYVAMDSADTWTNPALFMLDENLAPTFVAGCPPDYFSATGQLWGNPLYAWSEHEKMGFAWWVTRIQAAFDFFDVLRIDHFRGFASFYAIPFGNETAEIGAWETGPRIKLFSAIKAKIKRPAIIAEDLGFLTEDVFELLSKTAFPGMRVIQFGFDPYKDSTHLPHHYPKKAVVYTGTHDNTTVNGWMDAASPKEKAFAKKYLALSKREGYGFGFLRGAWASVADTAIAPMQDALELDETARINTPSTLGGNWIWRLKGNECTCALADKLKEITLRYGRNL
jgi:4-alpha-glucanotransferase